MEINEVNKKVNKKKAVLLVILILLCLSTYSIVYANQPIAPTGIANVSIEAPVQAEGYVLNTSGGTITNADINATTQNFRWKGFVGNISGKMALMDGSFSALFSWDIVTVSGEIYATRSPSVIDWSTIACADNSMIETEQTALNITTSKEDSINNTFSASTHSQFYVGSVKMSANTCRAITLNVNNTKQSTDFQEVLLKDSSSIVYASLLENSTYGFNNQSYDFQMIVAENALEGAQSNTAYYFYVELV